jgi:hypothetical protein
MPARDAANLLIATVEPGLRAVGEGTITVTRNQERTR